MKTPSKCRACGSSELIWSTHMRNTGPAQDGRLRMHEVTCDFVLGCNECSETLRVVGADDVAEYLMQLRVWLHPATNRGQQR